jgi:hypothetical protein
VSFLIARGTAFAIALTVCAGAATAASLEEIQGAWGTTGYPCNELFSVKNGKMSLIRENLSNTGFIVNGKRFEGSNATCNVTSTKQSGQTLTFALDCETRIIFDTAVVSVRIVDADTLVRFNPEFPELDTHYKRCK